MFSLTQVLFTSLVLGFMALQAPLLLVQKLLCFEEQLIFQTADNVIYSIKYILPGEDFRIYNVTRRSSDQSPVTVSFMCPCETPFQDLTIVHADTHCAWLEGIFSTKNFSLPGLPPETVNDYARGILQLNFSVCMTPELTMLTWLPLVAEQDKRHEISALASFRSMYNTSSSQGTLLSEE